MLNGCKPYGESNKNDGKKELGRTHMRELRHWLNFAVIYIFMHLLLSQVALAAEPKMTSYADTIHILKISPEEEKAVIKTPDGDMLIIKAGDILQSLESQSTRVELKVVEIAEGRVVLEEKTEKGNDTIIVRVEDGKQRMERISKSAPRTQSLRAPMTMEQGSLMKKNDN